MNKFTFEFKYGDNYNNRIVLDIAFIEAISKEDYQDIIVIAHTLNELGKKYIIKEGEE